MNVPNTAVVVDKLRLAKTPPGAFRDGTQNLYPEGSDKPFQIWDEGFLSILGPSPTLEVVIDAPDRPTFAWEAPVWVEETDEVFFVSRCGGVKTGPGEIQPNNHIYRVALKHTPPNSSFEEKVVKVDPKYDEVVAMTNGATNFRDKLLVAHQGRGPYPGNIALIDRKSPYKAELLVNNYHGRPFSAPNDLAVHPSSGAIYFTDPLYAYFHGFRPAPNLPCAVYRFNPDTGHIKIVAEDIKQPRVNSNGVVFSPDGTICYVTDSSSSNVKDPFNGPVGSAIYAFDVVGQGSAERLVNKRLLTWVDTGIPDGIKVDTRGNVYSSCGDGVQVWNPEGVLLGKIVVPHKSINLVFCGKGRLVFTAGSRLYLARIAAEGVPLGKYPAGK